MYRLDFHINESDEDDFTDRLLGGGAGSVSTRRGDNGLVVSAIFSDTGSAGAWLDIASAAAELEESIWKYRWLEDFHGYALNDEVYIYPVTSSAPLSTRYRHTIYIDPRDAFGDGRHPTTSMCLIMLYDLLTSRALGEPGTLDLLDVGTGTGILSILAALLGAGRVEAIDLDETSVEMARGNIALNKCANVAVSRCSIEEYRSPKRFDIVAANLLYGIIAENIDRLISLVRPGGLMIASGLSTRWEKEVEELFARKGLTVAKKSVLEEWIAYLLKAG
jgi:ribosomal protein L11 methyltransferase